ncbi:hypothetical protein [Nocardia sp. NPDC049526]|uniref:hypothetical protein n=1 Tax=Nocardia sp. NPDC049526 TaxID=3364316 RepID=UPI0037941372
MLVPETLGGGSVSGRPLAELALVAKESAVLRTRAARTADGPVQLLMPADVTGVTRTPPTY